MGAMRIACYLEYLYKKKTSNMENLLRRDAKIRKQARV
jgi:hypothetical protein